MHQEYQVNQSAPASGPVTLRNEHEDEDESYTIDFSAYIDSEGNDITGYVDRLDSESHIPFDRF
jgi:hypothetical protein